LPRPAGNRTSFLSFLRDTALLTGIHLRIVRWAGTFTVLVSFALPVAFLILMRLMNPDASPDQVRLYISGNMVNAVVQATLTMMAQTVAGQREARTFAYYVSLPIHKMSLILSLLLAYLLQSLPGLIGVLLVGNLVFGVWLMPHWSIIPIVLLLGASLSGLGALIGIRARNAMAANALGLSLAFMSMFVLPVYYPIEVLPAWLRPLAYAFPVTYGAHGIRMSFLGPQEAGLLVDLLALMGFSLATFLAVTYGLRWQDE